MPIFERWNPARRSRRTCGSDTFDPGPCVHGDLSLLPFSQIELTFGSMLLLRLMSLSLSLFGILNGFWKR